MLGNDLFMFVDVQSSMKHFSSCASVKLHKVTSGICLIIRTRMLESFANYFKALKTVLILPGCEIFAHAPLGPTFPEVI